MMISFVQFVYADGEWKDLPPFGESSTDLLKNKEADACCVVMLADIADGMTPAIEKLAARLMEEVYQAKQDGRRVLPEEEELDTDNGDD